MHSYLLTGIGDPDKSINDLAKKHKATILNFPILKIDDTRNLNKLIRVSFGEPTLIVCKNIHEATEEALNAMLKNLEEPQENIYFALTATGVKKVLPTIASRCQIINIKNETSNIKDGDVDDFFKMDTAEKINYVDKIKDRNEASEFVEKLLGALHGSIHKPDNNYQGLAKNVEIATQTLIRLKANGNVNLQLTNLAILLVGPSV